MVQPVRGPYGSTPPSNGGNLAGQESDYIQMLEAYIQLAAQKKDISQQTEEQLLS